MARSVRDAKLGSPAERERLLLPNGKKEKAPVGYRHWRVITKGLSLGYRRTAEGYGTWSARILQADGRYRLEAIGVADDRQTADGISVLTFFQAQEKARQILERPAEVEAAFTVAEACDHYMRWYREHRKAIAATSNTIEAHIRPAFGARKVSDLTEAGIRAWHERLAEQPARLRSSKVAVKQNTKRPAKSSDERRARKATANRVLTVLKAMLNKAAEDGKVSPGGPWTRIKAFKRVDEARLRYLTGAEASRLVNACPKDLRQLVRGALLTGARFGELVALRVVDMDAKTGRIYIAESKSGRPRHVPLNAEGLALFRSLATGKTGDAPLFEKADGTAWGKNHHVRPLAVACTAAKVKPSVRFHELRHAYASNLATAGVPLFTIAKLLGHSDTRVTERHYAHLADKTLADAVLLLPNFTGDGRDNLEPVADERAA